MPGSGSETPPAAAARMLTQVMNMQMKRGRSYTRVWEGPGHHPHLLTLGEASGNGVDPGFAGFLDWAFESQFKSRICQGKKPWA